MSIKLLAVWVALAMAACASGKPTAKEQDAQPAAAGPVNVLDISADGGDDKVDIVISSDGRLQYSVFKMTDPKRLIIDMTQASLSGQTNEIAVNKGAVAAMRPLYFASSNDSRLEVDLNSEVDYTINSDDPNELVISVTSAQYQQEAEDVAMAPSSMEEEVAPPSELMMDAGGSPMDDPMAPPMMDEPMDAMAGAAPDEMITPGPSGMGGDAGENEPAPEPVIEEIAAAPLGEQDEIILDTEAYTGDLMLENIEFKQYKGLSRVVISMNKPNAPFMLLSRDTLNRLTLDLPSAKINKNDERLINVNVEESKISNIAVFQFTGGEKPMIKVVVNLDEPTLYNVSTEGRKIFLDVGEEALVALTPTPEDGKIKDMAPVDQLTFEEKIYEGARISLDFFKADIHNILRIIADVSNLNVITSGNVRAEITIKLRNVPWDRALEVILKNSGLDMIREGNIIRVSTADAIQAEKKRLQDMQKVEEDVKPLFTKIFDVNYESAAKMKENLLSVKSERGQIEINDRTNTIIVKDTKDRISEMARLIRALDKKEQQVLIEARIVEVTHSHAQELGVQWGGYWNSVSNRAFPNTVGVTGGTGASSPNQPGGGSMVNLPTSGTTGGIGVTLGHVNGVALLDARLMAMENSGNGRIISMPKITTMNNKEATIESGREIPYQSSADGGGTKTEFKKATLSLKVTPHITPDKNVRMEIAVNKDEADFANRVAGGAPPILTKQAKTEVLVMDGSTTVIGGLFKDADQGGQAKVPGFGDIPLLGWLFRSDAVSKSGEELLIFITPKIVD